MFYKDCLSKKSWVVLSVSLFLLTNGFCKSISAAITSEVSLGLLAYDYNNYKGMKVNIDVYSGDSASRQRIWTGEIKFSQTSDRIGWTNWRRIYPTSQVKFSYLKTDLCMEPPYVSNTPGTDFICDVYQTRGRDANDIVRGNYVSWKLPNTPLRIQEVIDCVNSMRDGSGNLPQYKFNGWDCDTNVANCVSFSTRFIKALGVNIAACAVLDSWITPSPPLTGFSKLKYVWYCTLRCATDNIQPQYVLSEVYKNRTGGVVWTRGGLSSTPPSFDLVQIRNSLGLNL